MNDKQLIQDLRKVVLILLSPVILIFFILADFVYSTWQNVLVIRDVYGDLFIEIDNGLTLKKLFKRNM